jgi:DUF1680 family protein
VRFKGYFFNDSDVYKAIEGASLILRSHPDAAVDSSLHGFIELIAAAQEADGYIYTARTLAGPDYMPPGGPERWSDIRTGHELYCMGHLYEAAAAHFEATGKRTLLDVAVKNADLVCATFGPGLRSSPPGHQEIELGLVKLGRLTGNPRYVAMAEFFLEARGRGDGRQLYGEDAQDHLPVCEQLHAVGHAVRAQYMYAAMADIAALRGREDYLLSLKRLWDDVVSSKMYLTGGVGAVGTTEGFGPPYFLPNLSAYCETCASIAAILWNHRMFLLLGEGRYLDVLERVLYNAFLSGVGMSGDRFFYPNPLETFYGAERSPWFQCACCPPNVLRLLPQLPGMLYAHAGDRLYVSRFAGGVADIPLQGGPVRVTQQTTYPLDGTVRITLDPGNRRRFGLYLRIPGWAVGHPVHGDLYRYADSRPAAVQVTVNGSPVAASMDRGFAILHRTWRRGDVVEMDIQMPVRRVLAHDSVEANRGRVAFERGPIVYCLEGVDQPGGSVLDLLIPDTAEVESEYRAGLLGGITILRGTAFPMARQGESVLPRDPILFTAIPYYAWAHRGACEMTVWPSRTAAAVRPAPSMTLTRRSTVTSSMGRWTAALSDQLVPHSSSDVTLPAFEFRAKPGTTGWLQCEFPSTDISRVAVYWKDTGIEGSCALPARWRVLVRSGDGWVPSAVDAELPAVRDGWSEAEFPCTNTAGIRLEVDLQENHTAGIYELVVE